MHGMDMGAQGSGPECKISVSAKPDPRRENSADFYPLTLNFPDAVQLVHH